MNQWVPVTVGHDPPCDTALEKNWESKGDPKEPHPIAGPGFQDLDIWLSGSGDALPSHGGETHLRVSQSQVAELRLGSMLPASNFRKG
jgi:hypothetical protein